MTPRRLSLYLVLAAVALVLLSAVAAYVYNPAEEVVENVGEPVAASLGLTSGVSIPPDLADHQERAGLERGTSVGATPNRSLPRPDTLFSSYSFKGSPNWSGRGTCYPQAIVLHVTGPGTMAGMAAWFNNPSSAVSAHFGIGKQGEVHQYVEIGDASWNAGIFNRPNLANPVIADWFNTGVNPNRCVVGIELLLAGPAEPLVEYPAMRASLRALLRFINAATGIPLDRTHVIGHYEIDSVNRATDPRCCVLIEDEIRAFEARDDTYCCQQDYDGDGNYDDGYLHVPTNTWYWDVLCRFRWTESDPTWRPDMGCP